MYPVSQTSGYDRVATMFSPDGRLYQVEYASKIVNQGTIAVAMKYDVGVLFGAYKNVASKLMLPDSVDKMFKIDNHIAVVSAGLVGDARRLVHIARQKAQENIMYYEEPIQVETLAKEVSDVKQIFTQYGGMRPFGVAFIIGGVDRSGRRLFETEPSGAMAEYNAVAIGKNKEKAVQFLEKAWSDNLKQGDSILMALRALTKGLGEKEKMDHRRIEFSFIDSKREFSRIPNEQLKSYLGKI